MFPDFGSLEILLILVVTLLVIGPEKLPETLRALGLWFGRLSRSFNSVKSEIEKEISSRVREELDYHLEQKHMLIFSEIFKKIHSVNVPKVIETVSTKRLLTMNFLNGDKLLNFTKHKAPNRKKHGWVLPWI